MQLYPQITAQWEKLQETTFKEVADSCNHYKKLFSSHSVQSGLMLILNPDFLRTEGNVASFQQWRSADRPPLAFGCLLNFRDERSFQELEMARELGFRTLKLYPYLQKIEDNEFEKVARLAQKAESLGLYLTICCSYGTRALNHHSGIRLAGFLSEKVKCPVVMSHAGGAKLLDAFLVAEAAENLLLDTSFSLPYYRDSSVERDFAFAMRKLGAHRWMYGSDAPFVGFEDSLKQTLEFFDKYRFSSQEVDTILFHTAERLIHDAS